MLKQGRIFTGELIGTFLMCFFGIGAVANATLHDAMNGPVQVGLVWGLAITIAIFVTRNYSAAHFNPAVSVAMVIGKRIPLKVLPTYLAGQCVGAFTAAATLWGLFSGSVYKSFGDLGLAASEAFTVQTPASTIWMETSPNTAAGDIGTFGAFAAEAIGVFLLVLVIFSLTEKCNCGRPSGLIAPLFIGLTVTIIICVVGPLTDAGLNPARDVMPRLFGALVGWSSIAFSPEIFLVYVGGPFVGCTCASLLFTKVLEPMHDTANCDDTVAVEERKTTLETVESLL